MKRFLRILRNEFWLVRTSIPVHIVAMLQPTLMYLLMSTILVHPTFDMYVTQPDNPGAYTLVSAMKEVGSPIGDSYINPILIERDNAEGLRQVVTVIEQDGKYTALQQYGLIDSNMVKNFRNRLTAAGLIVWNDSLQEKAVSIVEQPWLPRDMPYTLYFGMAMLPLTVFVAASMIGAILTAQEFENGTILEYRLAPVSAFAVIGARLVRLVISGLISALILWLTLGFVSGVWPTAPWKIFLILVPVDMVAGCIGISAGLIMRKSIPAFLVGLVTSFVSWLVGSAFGLAAGFNRTYEFISRLTPNTHAVEMLYPLYFGTMVGNSFTSVIYLTALCLLMLAITLAVYHLRVSQKT